MSTEPDSAAADRRVERLANWVEELEARVDELSEEVDGLREENDHLRNELQQERAARQRLADELRDDIAEFDRRTSLLARMDDAQDWGNEQRAAYCITKLYVRAQEKGTEVETVDVRTAWEDWFDASFDRSTTYTIFTKAAEQTPGDVITFEKEPRGHEPPSRLVLDLRNGTLPEAVGDTPVDRCGPSTTPEHGARGTESRSSAETNHPAEK